MRRRPLKKLLTFLMVFAATIAVVAALSSASRIGAQAAGEEFVQQLRAEAQGAAALSAPMAGEQGISILASLGGFLGLLVIAGICGLALLQAKRSAQEVRPSRRPRKEPALRRPGSHIDRV